MRGRPMFLCGRGVWFEDDWISQLPRTIQISVRRRHDDPGFDLVVDSLRFRFSDNPDELADRLERWCRYYFLHFLPEAEGLPALRSVAGAGPLLPRNATVSPACGQRAIPRPGDVAVPLNRKLTEMAPWVTAEPISA